MFRIMNYNKGNEDFCAESNYNIVNTQKSTNEYVDNLLTSDKNKRFIEKNTNCIFTCAECYYQTNSRIKLLLHEDNINKCNTNKLYNWIKNELEIQKYAHLKNFVDKNTIQKNKPCKLYKRQKDKNTQNTNNTKQIKNKQSILHDSSETITPEYKVNYLLPEFFVDSNGSNRPLSANMIVPRRKK